uniref:Reverse transcriptase zinc-binding domain-containing protein n=1 Tax=Arundo donax TaxID=35708 RepID=A0A0A9CGX0_ARUDO
MFVLYSFKHYLLSCVSIYGNWSMSLTNRVWISDIQGALTVGVIVDYLHLWDLLSDVQLQPEVEDRHIGRLASHGQYSAKSAYESLFLGSTLFEPWERIWKTWAPPKCRFFVWLIAHNKCWTAERLARRGLPHPERCPLCDQKAETIDHLLGLYVFAREFWFRFFTQVRLQSLSPQPTEISFHDWLERASDTTSGLIRQGTNSLIILGAWTLWTHRNRCVFDGAAPSIAGALVIAEEEQRLWSMAGARGLSLLTAPTPGG